MDLKNNAKSATKIVMWKYFNRNNPKNDPYYRPNWLKDTLSTALGFPPNTICMDYIEKNIRKFFFQTIITKANKIEYTPFIKMEPIIGKMALEFGFEQEVQDKVKLNRIRELTHIMYNDTDGGKNLPEDCESWDYNKLESVYGSVADTIEQTQKDEVNNTEYTLNHKYNIVQINNFEEGHKYVQDTCSSSPMCYFTRQSTYDEYSDDDTNTFYICLRDDYKSLPETRGENCPYDDYGLSMIFIIVNKDGKLLVSNTRWNHTNHDSKKTNTDVNYALTPLQISNIIGRNFYQTFKPKQNNTTVQENKCLNLMKRMKLF